MRYLDENHAIVTVQKGGRITIPKKFRDRLGWHAGDTIECTYDPETRSITLRKVEPEA